MKNKILFIITAVAGITSMIGISCLDSIGTAFVVALLMAIVPPVAWLLPFTLINGGCW